MFLLLFSNFHILKGPPPLMVININTFFLYQDNACPPSKKKKKLMHVRELGYKNDKLQ